jgi:tetratricopeptide (TPR) repeat protein
MAKNDTNKGLTDKDFSDYYNKKMSERATHDFESKATDDDFTGDATDGFMDHPEALENLGSLKENFYKKNDLKGNFSSSSLIIISIAIALIVVFVSIFVFNSDTKSQENQLAEQTDKDEVGENEPVQPEMETPSKDDLDKTEIAKAASPKKVITIQKEIKDYEEELPLEKLKKKNLLVIDINNEKRNIKKKKVAFMYLADFKVVDYSNIYSHKPKGNKELNGLPAEYESIVDQVEDDKKVTIKYEDFLENALRKLKTEDIASCIEKLKIIKETYPEDLNADFYLGICYFNVSDYENSKKHFESALVAPYYVFDEETEWYLYLSYKALKKTADAKQILNRIKERKGFYYDRAMKE